MPRLPLSEQWGSSVQPWVQDLVSLIVGLVGGGAIGSLVTIKVVKTSSNAVHTVRQSGIHAGRDNIGGDKKGS